MATRYWYECLRVFSIRAVPRLLSVRHNFSSQFPVILLTRYLEIMVSSLAYRRAAIDSLDRGSLQLFIGKPVMTNLKTLLAISTMIGAASLTGCADMKVSPAAPVPDTKVASSGASAVNPDIALVENVKATLATPALKASHLKVSAKSGEVTLTGDVEDGQQLAKIAIAVQKIPGVKAVIPDMNPKR
jgi:BON domain